MEISDNTYYINIFFNKKNWGNLNWDGGLFIPQFNLLDDKIKKSVSVVALETDLIVLWENMKVNLFYLFSIVISVTVRFFLGFTLSIIISATSSGFIKVSVLSWLYTKCWGLEII
mgnify:CR=1 FL=1